MTLKNQGSQGALLQGLVARATALEHDASIPSSETEEWVDALAEFCKELAAAKFLASPYTPYWQKKELDYEEAQLLLRSTTSFTCPECKSIL